MKIKKIVSLPLALFSVLGCLDGLKTESSNSSKNLLKQLEKVVIMSTLKPLITVIVSASCQLSKTTQIIIKMPNLKEGEEKAIVSKSGSKKDRKESKREKSMRQKSSKSTKSTSSSKAKLKSTKSKKKLTTSADRDAVFDGAGGGGGGGGGQLKANKSNFSNSLTCWGSGSQTTNNSRAVDAPKQLMSASALDHSKSSVVVIKHKSTADHMLKPKSSGAVRHRSKSSRKVLRPKSAPRAPPLKERSASVGLSNAPGRLHIKTHGGTKAKTAKSHRQLKPTLTQASTYHQKGHVSDGECAHIKSPVHEVMIPAGRVYKVVKVHKVNKDGKQADAPWEYVWKYNADADESSAEEPARGPMAQNSSEVIRQPAPPAVNFVQVVKGQNLVLLNNAPQKQSPFEKQQEPSHSPPPPPPKGEKKEGKK